MFLQDYLKKSADNYGNKIALRFRDDSISYGQLEALSNQVAHSLLLSGVSAGSNVGLYLSKSIDAVAAIFGILKAGAAYVPIDPDSPPERTGYIIANCQIKTIVVDDIKLLKLAKNRSAFSADLTMLNIAQGRSDPSKIPPSWRIINSATIEHQPTYPPSTSSTNENELAYILYTSGSTGQPKGVMLTHKNATVFIDWAAEYLDLHENDVFSSHAPFHFDLSIFDIYVSFKVGGTLCLVPPGTSYFPNSVLDFIAKNKISVWYSVPSAIIQLLSYKEELIEKLKTISTLIYAGEVFPYTYLNQLRKYLTHNNIYNFYGPTETNVITFYKVDLDLSQELQENVPIGKPCPYANVHIIDENNNLVSEGEKGELIVNGDSLMQGYWGDPQKTTRSVKPISIQGRKESFYFTGDLVYKKPDDNIIYVNRRDNMVKTRGFRVELGEIETTLYKHPSIHNAAVIGIPDDKVGHRLYAFLSLKNEHSLTADELETFCAKFLPAYMIPEKIFFLDMLPLTATGKIDRQLLKQQYKDYSHE